MSGKRVESLASKLRYLGNIFAHVIIAFCFEGKKEPLGLHVVLDMGKGEIGLKQNTLKLQSQSDECAARTECAQIPIS